jgi:hypothetical protein
MQLIILDLLWRFRFSLVDNRRALTKFLLAVEWTVGKYNHSFIFGLYQNRF